MRQLIRKSLEFLNLAKVCLSTTFAIAVATTAFSNSVQADTFCANSPASIASALQSVSTNGARENDIRIVVGNYSMVGQNLAFNAEIAGDLEISGGWNPGCSASQTLDPRSTVLTGSNVEVIKILVARNIALTTLQLNSFAELRVRRQGKEGGLQMRLERLNLRMLGAVDISSERPSDMQLRNILLYDSGTTNKQVCVMSVFQEDNVGEPRTLIAHSTFAFNQGKTQLCLAGKERKEVRNNIFDGVATQQSVFIDSFPALLTHNRVQLLGGLPLIADSLDNFSDAPNFVNAPLRNFALAANSPAINRGGMFLPDGQSLQDAFANPRWLGMRPDVGALESSIVESNLVFTVTNSADSGAGSLRDAINQVNASPSTDARIIRFNIPDGCNNRITLNTVLPEIFRPLWLDGYSQPGSLPGGMFSQNTMFDAKICVGLVAQQAGIIYGIRSTAPLRIEGFTFGGFSGVGNTAAVVIADARDVVLRGNQFGGTGGFGLLPINANGLSISGLALEVQAGGLQVADRNLFADLNGVAHVGLSSATRQVQILNNWFGLDRDGSTDRGADAGVNIEGKEAIIKGNRFANTNTGVSLSSASVQGNRIQSNIFGVTPAFVSAPLQTAVRVTGGSNNVIGAAGDHLVGGNSIFNCTAAAIAVSAVGANSTLGARIRGNRIFNSTGLDIDLAAPGPTANDVGDLDEGPNRTMNHPVFTAIGSSFFTLSMDTLPGELVIDYYHSARCQSNGRGVSSKHLGRVVTSNSIFSVIGIALDDGFLSATATDSAGNTSELSPCIAVPPMFRDGFE